MLIRGNVIRVSLLISIGSFLAPKLPNVAQGLEPSQTLAYDRYAKLNSAERLRVYAEMTPSGRMELAIERANRWLDTYKNSLEKTDSDGLTAAIPQLPAEHFTEDHPGSLLISEEIRTVRYLARAIDLDGDYPAAVELKQFDTSAAFETAFMPADPVQAEHRIERNRAWNRRLPGKGMPLTEGRGIKYSLPPLSRPFDSFESSPYILLGTIEEQQPYLSEDMTAIYTEFKIGVQEVFKNSALQAIAPGELLSFEREAEAADRLCTTSGQFARNRTHCFSHILAISCSHSKACGVVDLCGS
jgi:hypothetical protein